MKSLQKFTMSAIGLLAGTFVASGAAIDPSNYATFKEGKNDIPAEWKGMSVRYEQKLGFCEIDVLVNGKKAGTAYAPDGSVEIAPFLKFGAENGRLQGQTWLPQ